MQLRLPKVSKSIEEAVITLWHIPENSYVAKNQDLLEIVTDKATFDVPAPCSGVLKRIVKREGDKVRLGEVIAEIEELSRNKI